MARDGLLAWIEAWSCPALSASGGTRATGESGRPAGKGASVVYRIEGLASETCDSLGALTARGERRAIGLNAHNAAAGCFAARIVRD